MSTPIAPASDDLNTAGGALLPLPATSGHGGGPQSAAGKAASSRNATIRRITKQTPCPMLGHHRR